MAANRASTGNPSPAIALSAVCPDPEEITLRIKRVSVTDSLDPPLPLQERGTLVFHAVCERRGGLHHEQLRRRRH
jgi:hypothetical protein